MKKLFLIAALVCSLNLTASAQSVTVEGEGLDRNEALLDAERNAVERVVGSFVDSEVLIENSMLELNRIYTTAQGFVRNVKVLDESRRADGTFLIRASMDVDDEPNTELMSRLETIMRLNDPRISIEIERSDSTVRDELAEALLKESLLEIGFNHVVVEGAEYLVLGETRSASNAVMLPNYRGGYKTLPYSNATAELTAQIIKLSTGEIVGSFNVKGAAKPGVDAETVERDAIRNAASNAAVELEKKFKRLAMKVQSKRRAER